MSTPHRVAVLANTAWYLANFRLNFMRALRQEGYEVVAIAPPGPGSEALQAAGIEWHAFPLDAKGTHPGRELRSVLQLRQALRDARVDVVCSHTPKGNLYTAMARWGLGLPQVAGVSGLGSSFLSQNWVSQVVRLLYRMTFRRMAWVFFENRDDLQLFVKDGLVRPERAVAIPGLGVDLDHFAFAPLPTQGPFRFLMVARLLGDKGVREYVQAARLLRARHPDWQFDLLGGTTPDNPSAIPAQELAAWQQEGVVNHRGQVDDVRPLVAGAHCVVLPSYREGMSRTLLEAAALGRPLVASDVPGCREAIVPGRNGLLCPARNAEALAAALQQVALMPPEALATMGRASREHVEQHFSEDRVTQAYLQALRQLA